MSDAQTESQVVVVKPVPDKVAVADDAAAAAAEVNDAAVATTNDEMEESVTPAAEAKAPAAAKGTPSKRKSKLERERMESEEIIKSMGGAAVEEGGRRSTRSSARGGVPASPAVPTPAKKARISATTPGSRRGRPKKLDQTAEEHEANEASSQDEADVAAIADKAEEDAATTIADGDDKMETDSKNCDEKKPSTVAATEPKEVNNDTVENSNKKIDDDDSVDAAEEKPAPKSEETTAADEDSSKVTNDVKSVDDAAAAAKADATDADGKTVVSSPAKANDVNNTTVALKESSPVKRPDIVADVPKIADEENKSEKVSAVEINKTDELKSEEPSVKSSELSAAAL